MKQNETMEKFMLCKYPSNGWGEKNNQLYLLDQLGNRIDFYDELDEVLNERFWYIDIPGFGTLRGENRQNIVDDMRLNGFIVTRWEQSDDEPESQKAMLTLEEVLRKRSLGFNYGESPLFNAMRLKEVFLFFEEMLFQPIISEGRQPFTIHRKDVESEGRFHDFADYTVKAFASEFGVIAYLG